MNDLVSAPLEDFFLDLLFQLHPSMMGTSEMRKNGNIYIPITNFISTINFLILIYLFSFTFLKTYLFYRETQREKERERA